MSDINGLLVIDKPSGWTSFDVVAKLRRRLNTRAIGHTGTLDPMATGVLVALVGTWTRLADVLAADDKRYTATIRLGARTDTDDADGRVIAEASQSMLASINAARVIAAAATVAARPTQVPPAYSAIQKDGVRMYARARRGEAVVMEPRAVVVHRLDVLAITSSTVDVDIHCGAGTYVRALARDIGEELGVHGHLSALRRTAAGAFAIAQAHRIDDPTVDDLRPLLMRDLRTVPGLPVADIDDATAKALRSGQSVAAEAVAIRAAVGVVVQGAVPVAIVRRVDDGWRTQRGFPANGAESWEG